MVQAEFLGESCVGNFTDIGSSWRRERSVITIFPSQDCNAAELVLCEVHLELEESLIEAGDGNCSLATAIGCHALAVDVLPVMPDTSFHVLHEFAFHVRLLV